MSRFVALLAFGLLTVGGLAACGGDGQSDDSSSGKVTVLAAASLTEAFEELGAVYEARNPGSEVLFSFAASSELAAQVNSGAPADVFASADEANMQSVVDQGMLEGDPVNFASNVLEIAVPAGNPGEIQGIDDFSKGDLTLAVCAPEVPCGAASALLLEKAGVEPSIDTFEPDVKSVLTKIELDEVDAGLIYHSDVLAAGDSIESFEVPEAELAINTYPIALLAGGDNPTGGKAFIDLVLSRTGQAELGKAGFRRP